MQSRPTLCLNMIVKNESHIIRRTLEMLCSKVRFDYWVICDTGSTDATREIIREFFSQKHINIQGELHCDQWIDFAHNRTKALNYAFGKTDMLLVFDADDEIHGTITIPFAVSYDEYHLKFGSPNTGATTYTRTLLINNRKRFQYFSVLHEFISCREPSANEQARLCVLDGDYFVVSGRSGARNQDPDKYLKDALLLEKAHADAIAQGDDLHKRYAFYCANSYRDCGRRDDAIRWYKITLSQDNWAQEKYVSCLCLYECYEALGQKEHGFFYLVKAFAHDLERVECLYPLIVHYCCEGMNEVAYNYYRVVEKQFLQNNGPNGKLFLETDKANFFVPYYMIIVADRMGDRACGIRMYEIVFTKKQRVLSAWHLRNMMFNLRFFIGHVAADALGAFAALANDYLQFIRANGVPSSTFDEVVKDFDYEKHGIHLLNQISNPKPKPMIVSNFSRSECKRSHNILFYTGYNNVPWNYSSMKRGALGGSEKAVAYLSKELSQQGYTVYVSGTVQPEELVSEGGRGIVKYVGLSDLPELLRTTAFHTVVCSRYISFLELYAGASSFYQFYIWAHDTHLIPYGCDLSDTAIMEKWTDRIDGCVCQTQWHADEYVRQYPALKSKIHVINNGIDTELFPASQSNLKQIGKFIYTSRTERGLSRILDMWPDIVAALPDATLAISTYVAFPCNDDERKIQARIAHLNQTQDGERIRHLGQLNPVQLYSEMSTAEYWLYPTDWPETSCITAMEMLMSEVICFYYPVAGLTETMGGCGIQIAPGSGSNIKTLMQISAYDEKGKEALRKQGRAYAESCSWANRAWQWNKMVASRVQRVAIFNSFPIHYEMFGYILAHFANATKNKNIHCNCNCKVSIFTETNNDMGWLDFYKTHFGDVEYECKPVSEFCDARDQFDIIFVPTDDDFAFKREWIDERCISIEHHISVRRPEYTHRVGVRPFAASSKQWALPCYEIVSPNDKTSALLPESEIHVAMIGKLNGVINYELVNRLSVQSGVKLQLHCIGRRVAIELTRINEDIIVYVHEKMDASKMIELLKKCDYVLTDFQNDDHINGISMSGVIPLSFSTLTPLIISKQNNAIYGFNNAVEFEMNSTERIMLSKKGGDDIVQLNAEKNGLIAMFDQIVANAIAGSNPKPRKIIDCFIFYNELEMLAYRLHVLGPIVDYFILVEARQTHVGASKPLHFEENKHQPRFAQFSEKIIHIVVDLPHLAGNIDISQDHNWINERFQRKCISRGLEQIAAHLDDRDVIIIADLDEIPDPTTLAEIKNGGSDHDLLPLGIYRLEQDFYYYNLNSQRNEKWYHCKMLTFKKYKELNISCDAIRFFDCHSIAKGGWHLSYFGDSQFIKNKLENFAHQEYNSERYTDAGEIQKKIEACVDLFNRETHLDQMQHVAIWDNQYLPPFYKTHLASFFSKTNREQKLVQVLTHEFYGSAWTGHFEFSMWLVKHVNPKIIVELGVDYGHSTFCLASPNIGTVYAIDCFEGDVHAGLKKTEHIFASFKNELVQRSLLVSDNIIPIKGFFDDVIKTPMFAQCREIDILHIDGLHTYEAVKNDFCKWSLKTSHDAVIIMHDVVSFPDTVGRLFNEIEFPKFYFTHSAGLGVVCKSEASLMRLLQELHAANLPCCEFIKICNARASRKKYCFIHSCTFLHSGTAALDALVDKINASGIIDALDAVFINNVGIPIEETKCKSYNNANNNGKYSLTNYSENERLYENPTLNKLKQFSEKNRDSHVLYLHTKGNSYPNARQEINDWTNMMLHFLVENHEDCFRALDGVHDTVGCNLGASPAPHYSGNFWWAKTNYIATLSALNEDVPDKMATEFWLFQNNPTACTLHSSGINHYHEAYPRRRYVRTKRGHHGLIIGFHSNQLCERGTEVALFDYAFYNQTMYGNKSIIFYNGNNPNNNSKVISRFETHFKCHAYNDFTEIDSVLLSEGADYFYSIGQGMDMRLVSACPNCLHDVFQMQPHGERYATVSPHLALSFNRPDVPSVPHIVHFRNDCSDNLREMLGIPADATVFGRYGGFNQFDISYVHEAICEFIQMNANSNAYFIFANTRAFCEHGHGHAHTHKQIIHVDTLYEETDKIKFINTCDAMIHARSDGETFGLSIAEFSIKNKPVITTHSSIPNSDAHIDILGERAVIYRNKTELLDIFKNVRQIATSRDDWNAYADYNPETVMCRFMEVFIDGQ